MRARAIQQNERREAAALEQAKTSAERASARAERIERLRLQPLDPGAEAGFLGLSGLLGLDVTRDVDGFAAALRNLCGESDGGSIFVVATARTPVFTRLGVDGPGCVTRSRTTRGADGRLATGQTFHEEFQYRTLEVLGGRAKIAAMRTAAGIEVLFADAGSPLQSDDAEAGLLGVPAVEGQVGVVFVVAGQARPIVGTIEYTKRPVAFGEAVRVSGMVL